MSDLHRFKDSFDANRMFVVKSMESIDDFLLSTHSLLLELEKQRFSLPWRHNQWSTLYQNACSFLLLQEQVLQEEILLKPESESSKVAELKGGQTKAKQRSNKIQTKLQKVEDAEIELMRLEYGLKTDQEKVKWLQNLLDFKGDLPLPPSAESEEMTAKTKGA